MLIAFDGQLFLKGNKSGVGICAENIMKKLPTEDGVEKQIDYFTLGYSGESENALEVFDSYGYRRNRCRWFNDIIYRKLWNCFPVPYECFFGEKANISVFFNFVIPPGVRGKAVAVVHDMTYLAYPETVKEKTRKFLLDNMERSCQRADYIVTISNFTKMELIKYLSVPEEKIGVIPLGVDHQLFHTKYDVKAICEIKDKYHIARPYILYIGTIEPRKNIERLVRAYAMLRDRMAQRPALVLAGAKGWYSESIFRVVETLGLKKEVRFLGYLPDSDIPLLLSGADAFAFPSIYEGFGLPLLEAMACGVPVVTASAASMVEVAEGAAVLVDPFTVESIRDGLYTILNDEQIRAEMIEQGLARAQKYSWAKTAEQFYAACKQVVTESKAEEKYE